MRNTRKEIFNTTNQTKLNLEVDSAKIIIKKSDDAHSFAELEDNTQFHLEGDTVKIKAENPHVKEKKLSFLNIDISVKKTEEQTITLHLANDVQEIKISGLNSDLNVQDVGCSKLLLDNSNSDVELRNVTIQNLEIDDSNTDLVIKKSNFDTLVIDSNNLEADFSEVTSKEIKIDSNNADINFDKVFSPKISVDSNNTDVSGNLLTQGHNFSLEDDADQVADKEYFLLVSGINTDVDIEFIK